MNGQWKQWWRREWVMWGLALQWTGVIVGLVVLLVGSAVLIAELQERVPDSWIIYVG